MQAIIYRMNKQQVLVYSTGNYIQYSVINCNGKEYKKEYMSIYTHAHPTHTHTHTHTHIKLNHLVVQQKLTQHCKSIILQ